MSIKSTLTGIMAMFGGSLSHSDKVSLDNKRSELVDARTASASQRKMNLQRGSRNKEHIGIRRIDRNLVRAHKASTRYCNNLDKNENVIYN